MSSTDQASVKSDLRDVKLEDKDLLSKGLVYASGTQALVRLPLKQKERDQRAGLNTASYVSGYRGSPLGGADLALWSTKRQLAEQKITFQPGLNEI